MNIRVSIVQSMVCCVLAATGFARAQVAHFRGRVLERADLQPVSGATVRWEGTPLSAITGADGRFEILSRGAPIREGRSPEAGLRLAEDGLFLDAPAPRAGREIELDCFRLTGATLFSHAWEPPEAGWLRLPWLQEARGGVTLARVSSSGLAAVHRLKALPKATHDAAGGLSISIAGLQGRSLAPSSNDQDFGDIILDYPPRRLDVGAPPIYGAAVLFAGGDSASARAELETKWSHWVGPYRKLKGLGALPVLWKIMPDPEAPDDPSRRSLMACCLPPAGSRGYGYDDILSKQTFRDFQLHVEFNMMGAYDDGKPEGYCNSGVYLQNRYEIQIMTPKVAGAPLGNHDIAAIVDDHAAGANPLRPQGQWQAYDVTFRSSRWSGGVKTEDARVTVWWNGVLVHDNAVAHGTAAGGDSGDALDSASWKGIKLQCEGSDVRFRNVWVKPLDIKTPATHFGY